MENSKQIKVALVDDHVLLRKGLAGLVNSFVGYDVIIEANDGNHFIHCMQEGLEPELVLLDLNMNGMDGLETAAWIRENRPEIRVLALSMYDNEASIIRMLRQGARGYILKDTEPLEFKLALDEVMQKGFYYSELVTGRLLHSAFGIPEPEADMNKLVKLNDRETEFLKLVCTELTYKEIADRMHLSPRTIDSYRDNLFEKLQLKTRVGLVMYAVKNCIVRI